jgi:DNA polymerase III sliding clamp (beta) subunit (PCNA family)
MPFPEETVSLTGICSLAKRTTFAVSRDESKPALQCVNIKLKNNSVQAAACDSIRMMLVKDSAGPTDEQEFLLPGRSLQMLASVSTDADVFEVSDLGKEVVFVRGDMMFVIRKMVTGDYIDTSAVSAQ